MLFIFHSLDRKRETTYEDFSITSEAERIRIFGQFDHVRIFGSDFEQSLTDAGLAVEIIDGAQLPAEMVGVIGPSEYDDNRVFICQKDNG